MNLETKIMEFTIKYVLLCDYIITNIIV